MFRRLLPALLAAAALTLLAAPALAQAADKDCSDFATQAEAQAYFKSIGGSASNNADRLDADSDGIACEDLPSGSSGSGASDSAGAGGTLPRTGSTSLPLGTGAAVLIVAGALTVWRWRYRPSH
jgi:hypothetical protein